VPDNTSAAKTGETVTFEDPVGNSMPIELSRFTVPKDIPDREQRIGKIPEPDPHYIDLGMLYRFAQVEAVRRAQPEGFSPLHLAVRGHMGTGKDHDIEQFAARLGLPYYRIPLTGEVRDVTLIGSTRLHGDGKGGTESRWEDGDITRALRGPALLNLSELNAAGAETLFALHGLLDRYGALDLPTGETIRLRPDVRVFGTMNPTDIRDYAGTQTLNKAFADRWVIWEKEFPGGDQVQAMLARRYPSLGVPYVEAISRLAVEVNASFVVPDASTRVETPLSLRSVLDRLPTGLRVYTESDDPLRRSWEEFVLPHVDPFDRDHYETVWNAVVRRGPQTKPFGKG
jgi:MoxR-like ATPase